VPQNVSVRQRFLSALDNGRVTSSEARVLERAVLERGVSASDLESIRYFVGKYPDQFDHSARSRLAALLPAEEAGTFIRDPRVLWDDRESLQWAPHPGKLFVEGPAPSDVVQNYLGDCYLMAAFSAVADASPSFIRNAIQENPDGTYTARFFGFDQDDQPYPVKVVVDGQLPLQDGKLRYASAKDRDERWVSLLEKAYAHLSGGYHKIEGGSAFDAIAALTGRYGDYLELDGNTTPEKTFDQMRDALDDGRPVVLGTKSRSSLFASTGLLADHCYAVLGVREEDGKQLVTLRNPWGEGEVGSDGKNDGIFTAELKTLWPMFGDLVLG
jgi:hypothetical protein